MISNDSIFNLAALGMLMLMFLWAICFFVFVYKKLGGPKVGRDALYFLNYMFFKKEFLSNLSLLLLLLAYILGAVIIYRQNFIFLLLLGNLSGATSLLLFSVYGRYFYNEIFDEKDKFIFLRVFLTEFDFSLNSIFLWLSRLMYAVWIILFIHY